MTQRVCFCSVVVGVLGLLVSSVTIGAADLLVDPSIERATASAAPSLQEQSPTTHLIASSRPQVEPVRFTKEGKSKPWPVHPKSKRMKIIATPLPLMAVPALLQPNQPTPVQLSLPLTQPQVVRASVRLERQLPNGQWRGLGRLRKDKSGLTFRREEIFSEPAGTAVRLRVSAAIRKHGRRVISEILQLPVATIIQPGPETTVIDPTGSGISVTIPADALTREVSAAITPLPIDQITAELGGRTPDAALTIVLDGQTSADGTLLTKPLILRVPAPSDLAEGARVIVAQPILADAPEGGGLREQLLAVDTALVKNGVMVTQATSLPGVFGRGTVLFLRELGSGFVQGQVLEAKVDGNPRPGVYVKAEIYDADGSLSDAVSPYIFLTDSQGVYKLFIDPCLALDADGKCSTDTPSLPSGMGTQFRIIAIDGDRCQAGRSELMTVPSDSSSSPLPVDTIFAGLARPANRVGVHDGGFELDALPGITGSLFVCKFFVGPLNNLTTPIEPFPIEGQQSFTQFLVSNAQHRYLQELIVPRGVTTLRFNFRTLGPVRLLVDIRPDGMDRISADLTITDIGGEGLKQGEIDLSDFDGEEIPIQLRYFAVNTSNNGGGITGRFELDNIRFSTVFVDVKILQGAMTDLSTNAARFERVRQMVRDANEILAQVGVNVRIRRLMNNAAAVDERGESLSHPCPGTLNLPDLLNPPIGRPPTVTSSVRDVLDLCRAGASTDVNVYFVNSFTDDFFEVNGVAVGPDDYMLTGTPGAGVIIRNIDTMIINDPKTGAPLMGDTLSTARANRKREVLAHELGHLLLSGVNVSSSLEHNADPGNVMSDIRCTPPPPTLSRPEAIPCSSRPIMTEAQSQQIHATNGGGFLVP